MNFMAAMLHALGATSLTLATELTARRYYMDSRVETRVAGLTTDDVGKSVSFQQGELCVDGERRSAVWADEEARRWLHNNNNK